MYSRVCSCFHSDSRLRAIVGRPLIAGFAWFTKWCMLEWGLLLFLFFCYVVISFFELLKMDFWFGMDYYISLVAFSTKYKSLRYLDFAVWVCLEISGPIFPYIYGAEFCLRFGIRAWMVITVKTRLVLEWVFKHYLPSLDCVHIITIGNLRTMK